MIINILVAGSRGNIFGGALRHLIYVYINQRQPRTDLISLPKEQYMRECQHSDQIIQLNISDTLGIENFSRILRSVSKLQNSDAAYILVYSSNDRASFDDITAKWIPLINQRSHSTPVVLVCANSPTQLSAQLNHDTENRAITRGEGEDKALSINNCQYIECNLRDLNQVNAVFITAINASMQYQHTLHVATQEDTANQHDQLGLAHLLEKSGSSGIFGLSTDNGRNTLMTFNRPDSMREKEENAEFHTQHEGEYPGNDEEIEEEIPKSTIEGNQTHSNLRRSM